VAEIARRNAPRPVNPRRRCSPLVIAFVLACTPEGSLGRDGVDGSGSGDGTTAQVDGSSSSSSTTEASSEHAGSSSSSSSGDTSSTLGDTGSSTGSESSTGLASCEPTGDDDACEVCVKSHCCEDWQVCVADESCSCANDCVSEGGALDSCTMTHCPDSAAAFMPLFECAHSMCMALCPWAA